MTTEKLIFTNWNPDEKLIETHLSGDVDFEDIVYWENSLNHALNQIEDGGTFKILVNLYGFKAISLDVHKRYREIIPLLLSRYNWKVGYVDLFEEAKLMTFSKTRNIECFAAAHIHQDEEKIKKYEERFSRENEHFFTDTAAAKEWISGRVN